MNEKISETPIREEKVRRLKIKILQEIEEISYKIKEDIKQYLINEENDLEFWENLILDEFSLLKLKTFIESQKAFQSIEAQYKDKDKDIVIYCVCDDDLNIYLQENYNFVRNFLYEVENNEFYNISSMLNDRFFGHGFISILDRILYAQNRSKK